MTAFSGRARLLLALSVGLCAAAPSPALAVDGGAGVGPRPAVSAAACVRACAESGLPTAGSTVRVAGRNFQRAASVAFNGRRGTRDDAYARAKRISSRRIEVRVPAAARTGTISVLARDGQRSKPSPRVLRIAPPDGPRASTLSASSAQVATRVRYSKVYFYGRRRASLDFKLRTTSAQDVRVDLVRRSDRVSVAHWVAYGVPPATARTLTWNGKSGARVPRAGTYEFRIAVGPQPRPPSGPVSSRPVQSSSSSDPPPPARGASAGSFRYLPHIFPVRGAHDYGSSGARFGAARPGHSHEGQDVMAACGTPLVAARGGTVQRVGWHSAAGNYVVLDTAGSGVDEAYMHLQTPSVLVEGDKVYTGQRVGEVGETGRAYGCHLHFEMWSAPGWYEGGSPFDPGPSLRAWDRVS